MKDLSVIIPFYNEEQTLPEVLEQVLRQDVLEIIAVDDGSKDRSLKVLDGFITSNPGFGKKIRVVRHKKNYGKGRAIISGLKKSKGKYVLVQDADLEYDPGDFPKLLKPVVTGKAEFVIGNRWQARRRGYLLAQLGNRYMNFLTNLLFGCRLGDSYSGYKLGPKNVWEKLRLKSSGFEIEAEISGKLAIGRFRIIEVPINYRPRTFSEGKKINWKDILRGTVTLFRVRFKDGIYNAP